MLPSGTKKRTGGKQQDPERIYREASAARKVKQYLDIHWEKIIKDEDRLQAVSKNLEPPPGNFIMLISTCFYPFQIRIFCLWIYAKKKDLS